MGAMLLDKQTKHFEYFTAKLRVIQKRRDLSFGRGWFSIGVFNVFSEVNFNLR